MAMSPALRVHVAAKWTAAADVAAFRLEALDRPLPSFSAGAHIDVETPDGILRQYSLVNDPDKAESYVIGVKREPNSRGGSRAMHDLVDVGARLAISEPRNHFALSSDAAASLLIAGGIGVTPLLAMAQTLKREGREFSLYYFARSRDHLAFREILAAMGERVQYQLGHDGAGTEACLREVLQGHSPGRHVYVCGPGPMLDLALAAAEACGWGKHEIHFEYFNNANAARSGSSFDVVLARSGKSFPVPSDTPIIEALRDHGVEIETSCEQGVCGTCLTRVLEGEPDHRDVFLSAAEKAGGGLIMPCVSRAKSARLVLDL